MKRCKLIFKISFLAQAFSTPTAYPLARSRVNPGVLITLKRNLAGAAVGLLPLLILILSVAVPPEVSAFNWRNMIDDVKNKIENHIDDKAKEKGDAAEKKVEEGIDRALGEQSSTSQQGSAGQSVSQQQKATNAQAQQRLNSLGYDAGPVDGALGPRSVKAIKAFQRDHGMAETGQISPDLLAALQTAGTQPITVQQGAVVHSQQVVAASTGDGKASPSSVSGSIDIGDLEVPNLYALYRLAMAQNADILNDDTFVLPYIGWVDPPPENECMQIRNKFNNPVTRDKLIRKWRAQLENALRAAPAWPKQQLFRIDFPEQGFSFDEDRGGIVVSSALGSGTGLLGRGENHPSCDVMMAFDGQIMSPEGQPVFSPWIGWMASNKILLPPLDFFAPMSSSAAEQLIDRINTLTKDYNVQRVAVIEVAARVGPIEILADKPVLPINSKIVAARLVVRQLTANRKDWEYALIQPIASWSERSLNFGKHRNPVTNN